MPDEKEKDNDHDDGVELRIRTPAEEVRNGGVGGNNNSNKDINSNRNGWDIPATHSMTATSAMLATPAATTNESSGGLGASTASPSASTTTVPSLNSPAIEAAIAAEKARNAEKPRDEADLDALSRSLRPPRLGSDLEKGSDQDIDDEGCLNHIATELSPRNDGEDHPPNLENLPLPVYPERHPSTSTRSSSSTGSIPSRLTERSHRPSTLGTFLRLHAHLILFSILGTLARLGINALTTYPTSPLGGTVLWSNFTGCLIMGALVSDVSLGIFGSRSRAAYIGFTTGFCGSFTSFSSYELDGMKLLLLGGAGERIMAWLGYTAATFALSLAGLQLGAHFASAIATVVATWDSETQQKTSSRIQTWAGRIEFVLLPLTAGVWAGAVVLTVITVSYRGPASLACVFAPLGAIARFWISRSLNKKKKSFPLGTFACNFIATTILAGTTIGRARHTGSGCQVLKGVGDGFCGTLSTVSTFVVELRGLKSKAAYVYAAGSVMAGTVMMIALLGGFTWGTTGELRLMC
ncbi:CrcB-like protein-domain-containing protein [Pyronema omphalodes]|nr:CrcB-like protein-domain-containing protein [Pyronema omphalodes]